ncbi:uncharacterized protein LOC108680181 [Hyalella azteca]|uniref:Uncharacterized protein LOC108680181 n=1 Tax=Hyalella azteca TaxID=294128 RepID=A0A8B7PEA4_HYAAZ|nr:uncharacterized protein LOC108680181 [Hyalella azteca]
MSKIFFLPLVAQVLVIGTRPGCGEPSVYSDCSFSPRCSDRPKAYGGGDSSYVPREPCRCDHECHLYGDCCPDAPEHNFSALENRLLRDAPEAPFACLPLQPPALLPSSLKVFMVDWCPKGTNSLLDDKCRKDTTKGSFNYTYLMDVPVVSSNSGIIYQNIFCGTCNREYYFDGYSYSLSCDCEVDSMDVVMNMQYQAGNLTWSAPRSKDVHCIDYDRVTCFLLIEFPIDVVHVCEDKVISSCTPGAGGMYHDIIEQRCLEGDNYFLQDKEANVYKNNHCALCNGVQLGNIICLQPFDISSGSAVARNDLWTISDLFDFDQNCESNYVKDPVFGECDLIENPENILENGTDVDSWLNETVIEQVNADASAESIVFTVFMSISIVCLLLHMLIFLILFQNRKLHSLNLFSMSCALFFAETFFVFGANLCRTVGGCYTLSAVVYYFFMAAFFWMNVISFDICKTFHTRGLRSHELRSFTRYSLYAWGLPAVMLLCAITVDMAAEDSIVAPAFAAYGFWFGTLGGLLLFFVVPVEIIFFLNVVMLIMSASKIRKQKKMGKMAAVSSKRGKYKPEKTLETDEKESRKIYHLITGKMKKTVGDQEENIKKLKLYASLAVLMGVPWIFATLVSFSVVFDYLFNIITSLQGVFIFLAFDCKKVVWRNLNARLSGHTIVSGTSSGGYTRSTSSSRTNSSSSGNRKTKHKRGESTISKATVDTTFSSGNENSRRQSRTSSDHGEKYSLKNYTADGRQEERRVRNSERSLTNGYHEETESQNGFKNDLPKHDETLLMNYYHEEQTDQENKAFAFMGNRTVLSNVRESEVSSERSDDDHYYQLQPPAQSPIKVTKKRKDRRAHDRSPQSGRKDSRNYSLRKACHSSSTSSEDEDSEDVVDV